MPISITSNPRRFGLVAALIAIAALASVLLWQRSRGQRLSVYVIGVPEKGEALFFGEKQCSTCHSIRGSGGRVAPDLSGTRPGTPAMGWLTAVLWNHAPGMFRQMRHGNVAYPHLSTVEMADILAFLYQAANADHVGDPGAGERVFHDKGCSECHSVRHSGGTTAPDLSALATEGSMSVWICAMWNHAQSMVDPIAATLGRWPQFTGSEMNDLMAYVGAGARGTPSRGDYLRGSAMQGWQVFQRKCIKCHSVHAQGGHIGPALGPEHDLPLGEAQFAAALWNHAPAMLRKVHEQGSSLPLLQGDEVADLHTFLASLRYVEPPGSALVGERVFSDRGCARCHGPAAQGTKLGPQLRSGPEAFTAVTFATALWRHEPQMIDRAEESGVKWPVLEASDIGDLVSFLNTPTQK